MPKGPAGLQHQAGIKCVLRYSPHSAVSYPQVGSEYTTTLQQQEQQLEALEALDGAMTVLVREEGADFQGLYIGVTHPLSLRDDGNGGVSA